LSGSLVGWGDPLIRQFDLVVFLEAPTGIRLDRLRRREELRFGAKAIAPGGDRHSHHQQFTEWAAAYDQGDMSVRSRQLHLAWLGTVPCRVTMLDSTQPVERILAELLSQVPELRG
jgi:hypothetical protein